MKELRLGELVRRRREELNISQERLCMGLCSIATLSRFENGRMELSLKRVTALLERLGLPHERYSVLLTEEEEALEAAEREARSAAGLVELAEAEERPALWTQLQEKLAALEALGPRNPFIRQCVLAIRATSGKKNGPCRFEERLSMLLKAIRITVPWFDLGCVGLGPYGAEELRIIKQIADTYADAGQCEEAIQIYRMGIEYLEANGQRLRQYSVLLSAYAYGYSRVLCLMGRWQESLDMTGLAIHACKESGRYHVLAFVLWLQAECYFYLGNREKSTELYHRAHHTLKATEDERNLESLDAEAKERLDITFLF